MKTESKMTATEARDCIKQIRKSLNGAREQLLRLYKQKGWESLGYKSWRECVEAEFELSQSYLYRELRTAEVELNISPIGEKVTLNNLQGRTLAAVEPEQQKEVWEAAKVISGSDNPPAAAIEEVINSLPPSPPTEQEPPPKRDSETAIASRGMVRLNVQKLLDGVTDSICKVETHFPDEIELLIADLETHLDRLRSTRAANVLPMKSATA